jgi:membrane protease subunit HflK
MERVFGGTDKIIIDSPRQNGGQNGGQNGVVPYLPLNELTRRPQTPLQNPPQIPQQNAPQSGGTR